MSLDPSQRQTLARLADLMIPASHDFPSASQAGVADQWLDPLLDVRPDLVPGLKQLLTEATTHDLPHFLARLQAEQPNAFSILAEVVPGAYFLNPEIRARLDYQGQGPVPIDPTPDYQDLLQSVLDRGPVFRPTVHRFDTRYDWRQSYQWNFEHVPKPCATTEPALPGPWSYAGRAVPSPLAIAAGPLLNGAWIEYYASLGFDVLTYKTVRSSARACYVMPNLQPVALPAPSPMGFCSPRVASRQMWGSWAVSFGMPSQSPDFWRTDLEATRRHLPSTKLLAVSIVASPEPDWTLENVAADFAQCARWAIDSGADCIEANFSCPNVASADAQLYQEPALAAAVAQAIRAVIGRSPLLIKIGHITEEPLARELTTALAPHAEALVMVNCVAAQVVTPDRQPLFNSAKRGIAGHAIRRAALEQIRLFSRLIRQQQLSLSLIGVGGIGSANDIRDHLQAGAEAVQIATAAMLDPALGMRLRRELGAIAFDPAPPANA